MGLIDFLRRLFFGSPPAIRSSPATRTPQRRPRRAVRLRPLRRKVPARRRENLETERLPYRFAPYGIHAGHYLDLSQDADLERLARFDLPVFHTPEQLADWLDLPPGQLAWLSHRFSDDSRPEHEQAAHYHFRWIAKRSGGWRLIEAPKSKLKQVQTKILREILDPVPLHDSAHGFVRRRSIVTNARRHVRQRVVLKLDLENFYANVSFSRVVGIFRGLGYAREAALWLAHLTCSRVPPNLNFPEYVTSAMFPFLKWHLPQGAPTSPALANLSAYGLDVRLSGLARSFHAEYTRYADDLTFSGPDRFLRSLPVFIPLSSQIVREERFHVNRRKRRVIRDNSRQVVAGVVVNERVNMSREDFDRLKAILHNCVRHGPASQNREGRADFAAYLRGRVAHAVQLNPERGQKLRDLYGRIDWNS